MTHGHVVVALLNNETVCKRLCKRGREVVLLSENPKFPARYVLEGDELSIWGVITSTVRSHVQAAAHLRTDRLQQLLCQLRESISARPGEGAHRGAEQQRWLCHRP